MKKKKTILFSVKAYNATKIGFLATQENLQKGALSILSP